MSREVFSRTRALMGTLVTIQVTGQDTRESIGGREGAVERAFEWFHRIEESCSRFDPQSEAMRLTSQIGVAVPVSEILYEAVQFAVTVSTASTGAFDPTVGYAMESRGFNRDYRTGRSVQTSIVEHKPVSYRDLVLDPMRKTIMLRRPLVLDLGAVAKGLAIDIAARELRVFVDYAIDAGGDLYLAGHNSEGTDWAVGIRHPRLDSQLISTLRVTNMAVCTSGDYERRSPDQTEHHIMDPRTHRSASGAASATVVAPTAMLADALATAAFVLGPIDGLRLLESQGVQGLIVSPDLELYSTPGMPTSLPPPPGKACIISTS